MLDAIDMEVVFPDGKAFLEKYWGYLRGGGLILDDSGHDVGQALDLRVRVESSGADYRLAGHVVKRDSDAGSCVIAFKAGEAHDVLLSQALTDGEAASPRRFARFDVDSPARLVVGDKEHEVVLVNLSREGCCIALPDELDKGLAKVGEYVAIDSKDVQVQGLVVWSRYRERGVQLSADEALPLLEQHQFSLRPL